MKGVKCADCAEYNWDLLWCEKVVDSPDTEMERHCRYYHEKDDRDVVKVIRCKDCKYAYITNDGECKYCDIWFPVVAGYMDGDYYCASAERKEDGTDKQE